MSNEGTLHFSLDPVYSYPTLDDRGENLIRQIAGVYESGSPREQSELLMDGTFAMMIRSKEMACATELRAPLPLPVPDPNSTSSESSDSPKPPVPTPPAPTFKKCRKCAGEYVFSLPSGGGDVTIIGSAPNFEVPPAQRRPYKTMSYVWGTLPPSPIPVPCLACGHTTQIPMLSIQRFYNLMSLGGGGNTIWLDALSIDQADPEDVGNHIQVMGQIYKNAQCVSVLLPASDRPAFECLDAIERDAKIILMHRANFLQDTELTMQDPESGETINVLSMVCQMFLENIQNLANHLDQFSYWSRAWTFQEWALAPDLEVAVEGWERAQTCFNLKSLVLGAAMLISRYKIFQHQYAQIKLGNNVSRGMVPPLFNIVKSVFPDEDLFLSYEETDPKKVSFQANFPHNGVSDLLGIRSIPLPPSTSQITDPPTPRSAALASRTTPLAELRARLILLLSAFASSERFAKYDADLVACWASMCNITYAYDRDDDFPTAKRKAISALRQQGMIVYDFLPDTTRTVNNSNPDEAPNGKSAVHLFRMYAKEHQQLNATNNAEFPGAPMFTGRADTISHLIFSFNNISLPTQLTEFPSSSDENVLLQRVQNATITDVLSLDGDDLTEPLAIWKDKAIYGYVPGLAGFQFWHAHDVAKVYLEKIPSSRRKMGKLVIVCVPFFKRPLPDAQTSTSDGAESCDLHLWGIVPADIQTDNLEVYREPINGSLVLVFDDERGGKHIVAYLVLSDHLSGSYLICPDREGRIDLEVRVPERGDMSHTVYNRQFALRRLYGEVRFEA